MPFITQGKTNWKFLSIVIILAVIVGAGALLYARRPEKPYQPVEIQKTEKKSTQEQGCLNSGGTVSTFSCCKSSGDFPNSCLIGACGCSPDNSHQVKICDCGEGKCFDGEKCSSIETPNGENVTEKSVELNFDLLKNAQYYVEDCAVQLKDGCFEQEDYLCGEEKIYLYVKLYGFNREGEGLKCVQSYVENIEGEVVAFGDLNGDGKKDAAVIINENTGGTGQIRILAAVIDRNGKPYHIASQFLGDRISINSININSEVVTVDFSPRQSEESVITKFRLIGNQLEQIEGPKLEL